LARCKQGQGEQTTECPMRAMETEDTGLTSLVNAESMMCVGNTEVSSSMNCRSYSSVDVNMRKKRQRQLEEAARAKAEELYKQREARGGAYTAAVWNLRKITDRDELLKAAEALLHSANRDHASTPSNPVDHNLGEIWPAKSDRMTTEAQYLLDILRDYTCNPQTLWQALGEQLPDVKFGTDWFQAASLLSSRLRLEWLIGIQEGLELAKIVDENAKKID
jgi:hypothetical protein